MEQGSVVGMVDVEHSFGQKLGVGMAAHDVEPVATEMTRLLGITVDLQVEILGDERGDSCLIEGIASGDVHLQG